MTEMESRGRIANLKLLHSERWKQHCEAGGEAPAPVPTAGVLFNRPNPINKQGDYVVPWDRGAKRDGEPRRNFHWVDSNGNVVSDVNAGDRANWANRSNPKYYPVSGHDWTSVSYGSTYKYQIPSTSVVNKVCDWPLVPCWLCKGSLRKWPCGWKLTAAQWIWILNLLCMLAHTAMAILTFHFAYGRWDRDPWKDTEHVTVRIYRITQIPTPYMIENNLTTWSPGWNLTSTRENDGFYLRENGMPINFASLVIAFFATSAVFHLLACIAGAFEVFWFFYWRQLDDAFAYWRWAEYSISVRFALSNLRSPNPNSNSPPPNLTRPPSWLWASRSSWASASKTHWPASSCFTGAPCGMDFSQNM